MEDKNISGAGVAGNISDFHSEVKGPNPLPHSLVKQRKYHKCANCDTRVSNIQAKQCRQCYWSNKPKLIDRKIKDALSSGAARHRYQKIRESAKKEVLKSNIERKCAKCGYSRHVEVCHIKAISSFHPDSLVSEVNALSNIILLCPTHHWEHDADNQPETGKKQKKIKRCVDCATVVNSTSTRCTPCREKAIIPTRDTKIDWPSPESLKDKVIQTNHKLVASWLGVSDNALRKYLRKNGIVLNRKAKPPRDTKKKKELSKETKECSVCRNYVSVTLFNSRGKNRQGLDSRCTPCKSAQDLKRARPSAPCCACGVSFVKKSHKQKTCSRACGIIVVKNKQLPDWFNTNTSGLVSSTKNSKLVLDN